MLDSCIQNFFRVSTLYRVGGGRTARNDALFKEGTEKWQKNMIIAVVSQAGDFCPGLLLLSEKKELL